MNFSGKSRSLNITGFAYNIAAMKRDEEFMRISKFGQDFIIDDATLANMAASTLMKGMQIEHCDINNGMITHSSLVAPGLWLISGVLIDQGTCKSFTDAINNVISHTGPRGLSATHVIKDGRVLEVTICRSPLRPGCVFWLGEPSDIPPSIREQIVQDYGAQIKKEWVGVFGHSCQLQHVQSTALIRASKMTSIDTSPAVQGTLADNMSTNMDTQPDGKEQSAQEVNPPPNEQAISLDPTSSVPIDLQRVMQKWSQPGATITSDDRDTLLALVQQNQEAASKLNDLIVDRQKEKQDEGRKKQQELIHLLATALSGDEKNPGLAEALKKVIVDNPESESTNLVVRASQQHALRRAREAEKRAAIANQEVSEFVRRCGNLISPKPLQGVVRASKRMSSGVSIAPPAVRSASTPPQQPVTKTFEDKWRSILSST